MCKLVAVQRPQGRHRGCKPRRGTEANIEGKAEKERMGGEENRRGRGEGQGGGIGEDDGGDIRNRGGGGRDSGGSTRDGGICRGQGRGMGEGNLRALGAIELLTQDVETIGAMLVDARNGFNELIRVEILWTVRHHWTAGARFAFKCYRHWAQLLIFHLGYP